MALHGPKTQMLAGILLLCFASHSAPSGEPWDVLIFTQNWPKSVCDSWTERRSNNTCATYPKGHWTVHGIWPVKLGTHGPNDCDLQRSFQFHEIDNLETDVNEWWTPIQRHATETYFWEHEWNKHGTCAVPVLNTEYEYFKQALYWVKQYEMAKVLRKAGITPGGQYGVNVIMNGVQSALRKKPQVICYQDSHQNSILLEVRICFDKSKQLVNCYGYTNCNRNKMVYYS